MPEVIDHRRHADVVLDHVPEEFEKREDFDQRQQSEQQHSEVKDETVQDVSVNKERPESEPLAGTDSPCQRGLPWLRRESRAHCTSQRPEPSGQVAISWLLQPG